ncbi:MAG: hypothetical protein DHS20C15_15440 [Planctomycetota bacterium]|nr:MAG: hypothetical protein DHS20C15_15440 [Planctomycetota bacterium]
MTRARSSVLPIAALALILIAVTSWLLLQDTRETDAGGSAPLQPSDSNSTVVDAVAPVSLEPAQSETLALPDAPATAELSADEQLAETVAKVPWRSLHGRVRRSDGGELPQGLHVIAAKQRPYPRIAKGSLQSAVARNFGVDLDIPVKGSQLALATRTPVRADGSFEMQRFPAKDAWLQLDHHTWFTPEPLQVFANDDDVELLIELGACVEGVLTDSAGESAERHRLNATTVTDPWQVFENNVLIVHSATVPSDASGHYLLGPLPADTELRLSVSAENGLQGATRDLPPLAPGDRHQADFTLTVGAGVSGVVLDEDDAPVPQASVRLMAAALDMMKAGIGGDIPDERTHTDSEGAFSFEGIAPGSYRLVLATADYVPEVSETPFELASGQQLAGVELRARRGEALGGLVVNADTGAPIEGARVLAARRPSMVNLRANTDRRYREAATTDATGRFHVRGFEEAKLRVWVSANGYVRTEQDVTAGDLDLRVELQRSLKMSGVVISLEDAEPVTDYLVGLVPSGGLVNMAALAGGGSGPEPVLPERVRDPDGRFQLTGLRAGSYELSVNAPGFARSVLEGVTLERGKDLNGLVIYAQQEARVSGRVVDALSGAPVPGALLTTDRSDMMSMLTAAMSQPGPRTHTDDDGHFVLTGLGGDEATITVKHEEFVAETLAPLVLASGELRELGELRLSRGASVYGTVVDELDAPIGGLTVLVANTIGSLVKRDKTDDEGHWRVVGLPPDTYVVTRMDFQLDTNAASNASMLKDLVSIPVTLEADEEKRVDLVAPGADGTTLEGLVSSRAGPVANATLVVLPDRGGVQPRYTGTDSEGHYEIKGLAPGPWLLQVVPSDGEGFGGQQGMPTTTVAELVEVGAGPSQRHDIRVPGGRLAGRVVAATDGRGLGGVRVLLERAGGEPHPSRIMAAVGGRVGETYSSANGEFAFTHLASGTYDLIAGGTNMVGFGETGWASTRLEQQQVHESRADFSVEIELEPGAALHGTVNDTSGKALANIPVWARHDNTGSWLSLFSETQTNAAGEYTLDSLAEGSWTLVFGGTTHAVHVAGSQVARVGVSTRVDAVLSEGAEIFIQRDGGTQGLATELSGELGVLPSGLSSLSDLMAGGSTEPGQQRLARVAPGSYRLLVRDGGELILNQVVLVTAGQERVVVPIEPSN